MNYDNLARKIVHFLIFLVGKMGQGHVRRGHNTAQPCPASIPGCQMHNLYGFWVQDPMSLRLDGRCVHFDPKELHIPETELDKIHVQAKSTKSVNRRMPPKRLVCFGRTQLVLFCTCSCAQLAQLQRARLRTLRIRAAHGLDPDRKHRFSLLISSTHLVMTNIAMENHHF